jgi:hypothetical protein
MREGFSARGRWPGPEDREGVLGPGRPERARVAQIVRWGGPRRRLELSWVGGYGRQRRDATDAWMLGRRRCGYSQGALQEQEVIADGDGGRGGGGRCQMGSRVAERDGSQSRRVAGDTKDER